MGNEMGNQNFTGVVREEETNTGKTKVAFREDVGRADENKLILPPGDEKQEFNENIKGTDFCSPPQGGEPNVDKETSGKMEKEQSEVQPAPVVVYGKDCADRLPAEAASLVKDDPTDYMKPTESIPANGPLQKDDHSADTRISCEEDDIQPAVEQKRSTDDGGMESQPALEDFSGNEDLMDASLGTGNDQDQQQQSGAIVFLETAAASLESLGLSFVQQDLADTGNSLPVEGKVEVNLTLDKDEESKLMEREIAEILAEMVLTEVKAEYSKVDDFTVNKLRTAGEELLDMSIDGNSLGTEEGDRNSTVIIGTTTSAAVDHLGEAANDKQLKLLIEMHMDEQDPLLMSEEAIPLADPMNSVEMVVIQDKILLETESGDKQISPSSLPLNTELVESGTELAKDSTNLLSESNQNRNMEPEISMIEINPENVEVKMGESDQACNDYSSEPDYVYSEKSLEFQEIASEVDAVLQNNNFAEEDCIEKEINVEKEDGHGINNKSEGVRNSNLYASEPISNGLRQEGELSISTTSQWEKCHQIELVSEDCKAPETAGSELDHGRKKLVCKLQKSPSFDFDLSTEARTEECDQTPSLYKEKPVTGSLSSNSDVEKVNTLIHKTEYVEDPTRCQPVLPEEKQVKSTNRNSHADSSRKPFLNLMKEEDEAAITVKPQTNALVSDRKNDKRKSRPSLFGTCIRCATMSVMH